MVVEPFRSRDPGVSSKGMSVKVVRRPDGARQQRPPMLPPAGSKPGSATAAKENVSVEETLGTFTKITRNNLTHLAAEHLPLSCLAGASGNRASDRGGRSLATVTSKGEKKKKKKTAKTRNQSPKSVRSDVGRRELDSISLSSTGSLSISTTPEKAPSSMEDIATIPLHVDSASKGGFGPTISKVGKIIPIRKEEKKVNISPEVDQASTSKDFPEEVVVEKPNNKTFIESGKSNLVNEGDGESVAEVHSDKSNPVPSSAATTVLEQVKKFTETRAASGSSRRPPSAHVVRRKTVMVANGAPFSQSNGTLFGVLVMSEDTCSKLSVDQRKSIRWWPAAPGATTTDATRAFAGDVSEGAPHDDKAYRQARRERYMAIAT